MSDCLTPVPTFAVPLHAGFFRSYYVKAGKRGQVWLAQLLVSNRPDCSSPMFLGGPGLTLGSIARPIGETRPSLFIGQNAARHTPISPAGVRQYLPSLFKCSKICLPGSTRFACRGSESLLSALRLTARVFSSKGGCGLFLSSLEIWGPDGATVPRL